MNEKDRIFFAGWEGVLEVLISAPIIYALVVLFVRASGKRTTGQMNNFDWIVTVAMGSIVASGIVINTVEVAETAAAVAVLIGLQYVVTQLTQRSGWVSSAIKSKPRVLIDRGEVDEHALGAERITRDELAAALRQHGIARLDAIEWLVLENTGQFTLVTKETARAGVDSIVRTEGMRPGA